METGKTLVHHNGALGDILLSLPCIEIIKSSSRCIHIAARSDVAEFLKRAGYADEASSSGRALYASLYTDHPGGEVEEFFSQFHRAFVFTAEPDSILSKNFGGIIPETKLITTVPPKGVVKHVSEFRLEQLSSDKQVKRQSKKINIPLIHKKRAEEFLNRSGYSDTRKPLIGIHPGSGGKRKCWPIENYCEIVEETMREYDLYYVLFSGPAEDSLIKEKIEKCAKKHERVIHISDEDLVTVAALLNLCNLFVGNDSGITHLAAYVNGKIIALFGPTDPLLWSPLGEQVHVITPGTPDNNVSEIPLQEVLSKFISLLA